MLHRSPRRLLIALAIALAVTLGTAAAKKAEANLRSRASEPARGGGAEADGARNERDPASAYRSLEARVANARRQLAEEARAGADATEVAAIHARAERLLAGAILDEILPSWRGVPWREGKGSAARRPDEEGAAVNCGSFVVAVLEGAGFRVAHRDQLGRAPALRILEAVADEADGGDDELGGGIARWRGTIPGLERELLRRGPGLYLLGLARHVGFAVVAGDVVRLVHASRGAGQVVDEPMAASEALLRSRGAPIFVAKLFASAPASDDDAQLGGTSRGLVRRWLAGAALGPR